MSNNQIDINFEKEILKIKKNNKANYYIYSVIQKNIEEKILTTYNPLKDGSFKFSEILSKAKYLTVNLKTNDPVLNLYAVKRSYKYRIDTKEKK